MNVSWGANTTSVFDWILGHQGLMQDKESDLYYNRNRCLHPDLAFIGRDFIEYHDGMNLYQYVKSGPVNYRDPAGLGPIDWIVTGDWNPSADQTQAANSGWVEGWGNFGWWIGKDDSGSLGQLAYTGDWKATEQQVAAAVQGAQEGANCATKCIACENQQMTAWIAATSASGVAFGATPRPVAELIAGGVGAVGTADGLFWKSGVHAIGVGLNRWGGGGLGLGNLFTKAGSAFKNAGALGKSAQIGAAAAAALEIYIAQDCARKCLTNPCYTC